MQTCADWECVCVDDGSTDGSGGILGEYAARDGRFKVIHKTNEGVAVARNVGLDAAKGEWITWLDADDEYAPWRLEEALRLMESENPDLVRFRTRFVYEDNCSCAGWERVSNCQVFVGDDAKKWCWDVLLPAGMMWTFVAKRGMFECNRFIPGMRVKEEFPVCARIATRVCRVVQSEAKAYQYRQIGGSAMHSGKTSNECVNFLIVVKRLMLEACFSKSQMGEPMFEAMKQRVRMHCECDILDWVRIRANMDNGSQAIYAAYRDLRNSGWFECSSVQQWRYRLPVWWWDKTGQIWGIQLMVSFERLARKLFGM